MNRKRFIGIILLFIILMSLEYGIFIEVLWHGWGGFGDVSLEYTAIGSIGISYLIFFIPVIAIVIFLIRLTLCIKKRNNMKELVSDCICALFGIGIGIGIINLLPIPSYNPFFWLGRQIAAFFIDHFNWMTIPIP